MTGRAIRLIGGLGALAGLFRGGWKRLLKIAIVVALIIALLWWLSSGASLPDDGEPISTSPGSALEFLESVTAAGAAAANDQQASLVVTDEQVTSFLQIGSDLVQQNGGIEGLESFEELARRNGEAFDEIPGGEALRDLLARRDQAPGLPGIDERDLRLRLELKDPEVRFLADGSAIVRGTGNFLFLNVPARVVVAPRVENGELVFDFVEGQLGRVGLPEGIIDRAGDALAALLLAGQDYAEITEISIGQGTMRLAGKGSAASP